VTASDDGTAIAHGNPWVEFPAGHPGGRIEAMGADDSFIWRSYTFPRGAAGALVDVWHGEFAGIAQGWAVLEPGTYRLACVGSDGRRTSLGERHIAPRLVVDREFDQTATAETLSGEGWQVHGEWAAARQGLMAEGGPAFLFHEGAMHGVLEATFHWDEVPQSGKCWGLIARHYNAFHHMRLLCVQESDQWRLCLARCANAAPDLRSFTTVAEQVHPGRPPRRGRITWTFNGDRHRVELNGERLLEARDGYMGGVEIIGLFADPETVAWEDMRMLTTQKVLMHIVEKASYAASIRPGNIGALFLRESRAPRQNLCWESGVQFGHIGGSEIKFTQGAELTVRADGEVLTSVAWSGPMPKFVEQARDVRGWAYGRATFYSDRIVVDDRVLTWVRRSVGPDLDLLSGLLAGPARVCLGDDDHFTEWVLPQDGRESHPSPSPRFPAAIAVPLCLGGERWWLTCLCLLRYPDPARAPARLFAWRCPRGLTASHDIRVTPTEPGREYAYTLVISWEESASAADVERNLLHRRAEWLNPMTMVPLEGATVTFDGPGEHPREALDFNGCFDMSTGRYVLRADAGRFAARLEPGGLVRRSVVLAVRDWPAACALRCRLDGRALKAGEDFVAQSSLDGELNLRLLAPLSETAALEGEAVASKGAG